MEPITTVIEVDDRGRVLLSIASRKALGIIGRKALLKAVLEEIPEKREELKKEDRKYLMYD